MTEWVAVCADETEEPVEIPTESDGMKGGGDNIVVNN